MSRCHFSQILFSICKVDFTSGVSEVFDLTKSGYQTDDPEKKRELFNIMCSEIEDHALMCCAIQVRTE